jgi:DNA-binding NarL/FixJ family response regulator
VTTEPADSPITVLVADDDDRFAEALTALLESEGLVVVGRAANGTEAIELAGKLRPTVVTMDIGMPISDGIDATGELAARGVKVVILSSWDDGPAVRRATDAGAVAALSKSHAASALPVLLRAVARA